MAEAFSRVGSQLTASVMKPSVSFQYVSNGRSAFIADGVPDLCQICVMVDHSQKVNLCHGIRITHQQ